MNIFLYKGKNILEQGKEIGAALGLLGAVCVAQVHGFFKRFISSSQILGYGQRKWKKLALGIAVWGTAAGCHWVLGREVQKNFPLELKPCLSPLNPEGYTEAAVFETEALALLRIMRDESYHRDVSPEFEKLNNLKVPGCALRNFSKLLNQVLVEGIPLSASDQKGLLRSAQERAAQPILVLGGWLIQGLSHTSRKPESICLPSEVIHYFQTAEVDSTFPINGKVYTVSELTSRVRQTQACPIR